VTRPRVLVVTTVHHPDDNRIREKTIRSLGEDFDVVYAARSPGPTDAEGLRYMELTGGRLRRNLAAVRAALSLRYDILSIHDPELLPLALLVRLARPVVFDVHEDIPAQILHKGYLPAWSRRPLARLATWLLRIAERVLVLTLAEEGYVPRFGRVHAVIANHPRVEGFPAVMSDREGSAIYVGDVTVERGLVEAVEAAGQARIPLEVVGPVDDAVRAMLETAAARAGTRLTLTGRLPHAQAMARVATSRVALSPLRDLPNYRESIPTKVIEYLALGVPVVATDLPATRRLVGGLQAVELVPPGRAEPMAAAMARLARPEAVRLATDQAPAVRRRYGWDGAALRSVYRAALL
jgi:glycosyltransferase involved in cell wall biosynthesis